MLWLICIVRFATRQLLRSEPKLNNSEIAHSEGARVDQSMDIESDMASSATDRDGTPVHMRVQAERMTEVSAAHQSRKRIPDAFEQRNRACDDPTRKMDHEKPTSQGAFCLVAI